MTPLPSFKPTDVKPVPNGKPAGSKKAPVDKTANSKNVENLREKIPTENSAQLSKKNSTSIGVVNSPPLQETSIKITSLVKGLSLKNVIDFQEYYESHLLPMKAHLSDAEFSRRCALFEHELFKMAVCRLYTELNEGKVSFTSDGQVLNSTRTTPEWFSQLEEFLTSYQQKDKNPLNAIKNFAVITHEVFNLKNDSKEFLVAKWVGEGIVKKELTSKKEIQSTQQVALMNFLGDPKLNKLSLSELKSELKIIKRNAYLTSCGISFQDQQKYLPLLKILEEEWNNWLDLSNLMLQKKRESLKNFPPLATERIVKFTKIDMMETCKKDFKVLIELSLKNNFSELATIKEKFMISLENKLNKIALERANLEAFSVKWGFFLKREMIQGFKDPSEDLGVGVCFALSLRWAIQERKKNPFQDSLDHLETLNVGSIGASDRFYQALKDMDPNYFRKKIGPKLGIKNIELLECAQNISGKDAYTQSIKKLISDPLFANVYQGAGQLLFGWTKKDGEMAGHAITITCQEDTIDSSKSTFRIIDPNFGLFEFNVNPYEASAEIAKKEFVDCLSDVLLLYADKMNYISTLCFDLA